MDIKHTLIDLDLPNLYNYDILVYNLHIYFVYIKDNYLSITHKNLIGLDKIQLDRLYKFLHYSSIECKEIYI